MVFRQWIAILVVCLALLGLDLGVKAYTFQHISPMHWSSFAYPYGGVPVFQNWYGIDFSLNYVKNTGAAWGVFSSFQSYLLYARFFIIGALLIYTCLARMKFISRLCLFVIVTGAIGNVIDFFLYGHVVDLFHFCFWGYFFPVFNIADSAIFCGVATLMGLNFFESFAEKRKKTTS